MAAKKRVRKDRLHSEGVYVPMPCSLYVRPENVQDVEDFRELCKRNFESFSPAIMRMIREALQADRARNKK